MNNKTLLYVGIAAAAYYLYNKSKKNDLAEITASQLQTLTDSGLSSFIADLQKNPQKYVDAKTYLTLALAEQKRRIGTQGGGGVTTSSTGAIFSI